MSTSGPNQAGAAAEFDDGWNPLVNVGNAIDDNDSYCTCVLDATEFQAFTNFFDFTSFGTFAGISAGDVISSIKFEIAIKKDAGLTGVKVWSAQVLASGSAVGSDQSPNLAVGTSETYLEYDATVAGQYGTTLTGADLANFGMRFQISADSGSGTVYVDACRVTLTYSSGSPAPTVSSVSASVGPLAGGTNVTITGTGFDATPTVTFGGSSATNVVRVNATTITCTTPAHAAGAVNVVVTNSDTQTGTGTNAFTYVAAPTISTVENDTSPSPTSPAQGPTAGNTAILINGTGFNFPGGVDSVTVGGAAATSVTTISPTLISCRTPAHAAGAANVVVTNPDTQAATATNAFTYVAAPTVSGVSANSGPAAGGTNVTITGTGFLANPTSVTFGGSAATNVVRTNSTTITCTTPSHAAGAVDVVVTNSDAQAGTGTNVFTFVAAPTVSGVSASSGSTAGGTAVTVSGTGFVATPTITFGGDAATGVAFVNSTTLTCTTPAHAAGAVDVVVTNPDTQTGTGAGAFTYTAPASNPTAPLSAGLPKIDQSFRSFNAGQGGFF